MEDLVYHAEKNRNVGANFVMLVGALFFIGAIIFREGFLSANIIRYIIFFIGIFIFMAGIFIRFTKINDNSDYV